MPQVVCKQPLGLFEACLDNVAVHIDDILKYEELMSLNSIQLSKTFHRLPNSLYQLVSEKILLVGALHDENYKQILNGNTRSVVFGRQTCKITRKEEFLEYLREHCKNVVKVDLEPLLNDENWEGDLDVKSVLVGETLASMDNLEWINLSNCDIFDDCLKFIGSKCFKLKYLKIQSCIGITDEGIRYLFDPSVVPYVICTQLTHLYIRLIDRSSSAAYFYNSIDLPALMRSPVLMGKTRIYSKELTPSAVSLALLHCPNLETLDYPFTEQVLDEAMSTFVAPDWRDDYDSRFDTCKAAPQESKTFKLQNLEFHCAGCLESVRKEQFFSAVGKYCPYLNDLTLTWPNFRSGDLKGISHLPLRSVTLYGRHGVTPQVIDLEIIMLLRAVGATLTTLKLQYLSLSDLRVLSRECPNLTSLRLDDCDMNQAGAMWQQYEVNELGDASFKSLTGLHVRATVISDENFVALLSSPNLERVVIGGPPDNIEMNSVSISRVIPQLLRYYPSALSKLIKLQFRFLLMDRAMLSSVLDRAAVLSKLSVLFCFSVENGQTIDFNEEQYVGELIRSHNWALKSVWAV